MCLQQSFTDLFSTTVEGQTSVLSDCGTQSHLLVHQVVEEQLFILWQTPRQPSQGLLTKGSLEGEEGD